MRPGERAPFQGVIALVGLAGKWTGSGRISCSLRFASRLCASLLMAEYGAVNEEVLDAVAEVSNMIIGNVKTTLEDELGPLGLSIPTVIYGRNYQARSSGITEWTVVPSRQTANRWKFACAAAWSKPHASRSCGADSLRLTKRPRNFRVFRIS